MSELTARLDAIQAKLDAATPGPWRVRECSPCTERGRLEVDVWDEPGNLMVTSWCDDDEFHRPDAEFIAASPENTRFLLDLARKQQAALDAALTLAEEWRYKGEHGWGAWQEGHGPDHEGYILDGASADLRAAITEALEGPEQELADDYERNEHG